MEILNCNWPYRSAQCPGHFSTALRETADPLVAVCESCLARVHLCRTPEEADARAARGERVAKGYLLPGEVVLGVCVKQPFTVRGPRPYDPWDGSVGTADPAARAGGETPPGNDRRRGDA